MTGAVEYTVEPAAILEMGPSILVEIAGEPGEALLDTGAAFFIIHIETVQDLHLEQDSEGYEVIGATGGGSYPRFQTTLHIPALEFTIHPPIPGLPLLEHGHPWVAIIGRDVLCRYEFSVNGQTGLIRFSNT